MIRHVVMWKLREEAEGASRADNALRMRDLLLGCSDVVPGIRRMEVGIAAPGSASTWDVVLESEFESWEALDAYQTHPKHLALKPFVAAVREGRECVDYET